jgi:hypothetical protein
MIFEIIFFLFAIFVLYALNKLSSLFFKLSDEFDSFKKIQNKL